MSKALVSGTVLAAYGRHFLVQSDQGEPPVKAVSKGRNANIAVGDRVELGEAGKDQAVIASVVTRTNRLQRSTGRRIKVLAANIDQAALVLAPEPPFSEAVVLRVSMEAIVADIRFLIIANKHDSPAFEAIEPRLKLFESIGFEVLRISARAKPDECRATLAPILSDRTTLLMGESAMGKSTMLNVLVPDAEQRTGEFSRALQSGKHTTTFSRMFTLDPNLATNARVIDSPGFQQFGIAHLSGTEREHAMPEFSGLIGQCRFNNCSHQAEPDCAIRDAVDSGKIDRVRFKIFCELGEE